MKIKPYRRKAQFYETDQMGIIHHANYIRWFEEARVDFMEQINFGYEKSMEAGIDIAVLEVSCQYKKMVKFNEIVDIYVSIKKLTPAKMIVEYRITDENGGLRTTGESVHCFLDSREHGIVRLDRALPELYGLFGNMVEDG